MLQISTNLIFKIVACINVFFIQLCRKIINILFVYIISVIYIFKNRVKNNTFFSTDKMFYYYHCALLITFSSTLIAKHLIHYLIKAK